MILAELFLGEMDHEEGKFQVLIDRFERVLENYSGQIDSNTKLRMMELLGNAYKMKGDNTSFLRVLEQRTELLSENYALDIEDYKNLVQFYTANAVKDVETKMSLDKRLLENEIDMVNEREYQSNLRSGIIISALILLMVVGFMLFRKYKSGNEQRAQLKDAKLQLVAKEKEILSWENPVIPVLRDMGFHFDIF